jgi:branched-chain amino acid aminotransferase
MRPSQIDQSLRSASRHCPRKPLAFLLFNTARDDLILRLNHAKLLPVSRIEERSIQRGPRYQKARDGYWKFAHARSEW